MEIASGEFTNLPLIEHIVKIQKTPNLSTGLTYDKEIKVVLKLLSKIKIKLLYFNVTQYILVQ